MKRFVSSVIYMMAWIVAMTLVACNEYDEEDISRPSQVYDVQVETLNTLTDAETVQLNEALAEGSVDTLSMCVRTDDINSVAARIKNRLADVNTAMMIGFKVQGSRQEDRYAARIIIGNFGED